MKIPNTVLSVILFIASSVIGCAQSSSQSQSQPPLGTPESESPLWVPKGSITIGYQDLYLAARVSKPVIFGPSMWADISLEWQNGFCTSYTQYESLNRQAAMRDHSPELNEAQIAIGYKWKWNETSFRLQSTLINLHPHAGWFEDDRLALELYVSHPFTFDSDRGVLHGRHVLTPEFRLGWFSYWDRIDGGVPFAIPAINHVWNEPFGLKPIAIRSRIAVESDGGFLGHGPGSFLQLETSLQWKLTKNVTLSLPGWRNFDAFGDHRRDGRDVGHDMFFASMTYRF